MRNATTVVLLATALAGIAPAQDFGDAPDPPYPSLIASGGAVHVDPSFEWLGASVSSELDAAVPNADDDDGVRLLPPYTPGTSGGISVVVSVDDPTSPRYGPAPGQLLYLSAWADWNGDGDWDDPGEYVVRGLEVDASTFPDGVASKRVEPTFPVPSVALAAELWFRVRLDYGQDVASPTGPAAFGEVEDVRTAILTVPGDHATVQAAVDAAAPGDAIVVAPGTWGPAVVSTEALTLQGTPGMTTLATAVGPVVHAPGVADMTVRGLTLSGGSHGVLLEGGPSLLAAAGEDDPVVIPVNHVLLADTLVVGSDTGIRLTGEYDLTVRDLTLEPLLVGLDFEGTLRGEGLLENLNQLGGEVGLKFKLDTSAKADLSVQGGQVIDVTETAADLDIKTNATFVNWRARSGDQTIVAKVQAILNITGSVVESEDGGAVSFGEAGVTTEATLRTSGSIFESELTTLLYSAGAALECSGDIYRSDGDVAVRFCPSASASWRSISTLYDGTRGAVVIETGGMIESSLDTYESAEGDALCVEQTYAGLLTTELALYRAPNGTGVSLGGSLGWTSTDDEFVDSATGTLIRPGLSLGVKVDMSRATWRGNIEALITLVGDDPVEVDVFRGELDGNAIAVGATFFFLTTPAASSHITLDECTIANNQEGIRLTGLGSLDAKLLNSTVRNNGTGIVLAGSALTALGNTICSNETDGVIVTGEEDVDLSVGNFFGDNGGFEIVNLGTGTVDARNADWGVSITAEMEAGATNVTDLFDCNDDSSVGCVLFDPWEDPTETCEPECYLLIGTAPDHVVLPSGPEDVLLLDLLVYFPVTMTSVPVFAIPDTPVLQGLHVYGQVFLLNELVFPSDPVKLSNGVDVELGVAGSLYGAGSGMDLWLAQPPDLGGELEFAFSIDGL